MIQQYSENCLKLLFSYPKKSLGEVFFQIITENI